MSLTIVCRYANNESYSRAVEDFEEALKLDSQHVNAKKYMCETLLAHAQTLVSTFAAHLPKMGILFCAHLQHIAGQQF